LYSNEHKKGATLIVKLLDVAFLHFVFGPMQALKMPV